MASRIYWPLCASVLVLFAFGLISSPPGNIDLSELSTQSFLLIIAAAGLLGIRFCSAARMDLGAFLSSSVLVCGLILSLAPRFAAWSEATLLAGLYSMWTFASLRQIVMDTPDSQKSDGKIAGNTHSFDEAYSHSR